MEDEEFSLKKIFSYEYLFGEKRKKYKFELESFKEVMDKYKYELEKLGITSKYDQSIAYAYLLWNGYFSADKKLSYELKVDNPVDVDIMELEIVNGRGVCRNFSQGLKDFLRDEDINAFNIGCLVNNSMFKSKKEDIAAFYGDRKINKIIGKVPKTKSIESLILSPIIKRLGNHAVTLVKDGDKYFYYDSTNILSANYSDDDKMYLIECDAYYEKKDCVTKCLNTSEEYDTLCSLKETKKITRDEANESYNRTYDILKNSEDKLKETQDETSKKLVKIKESIIK